MGGPISALSLLGPQVNTSLPHSNLAAGVQLRVPFGFRLILLVTPASAKMEEKPVSLLDRLSQPGRMELDSVDTMKSTPHPEKKDCLISIPVAVLSARVAKKGFGFDGKLGYGWR